MSCCLIIWNRVFSNNLNFPKFIPANWRRPLIVTRYRQPPGLSRQRASWRYRVNSSLPTLAGRLEAITWKRKAGSILSKPLLSWARALPNPLPRALRLAYSTATKSLSTIRTLPCGAWLAMNKPMGPYPQPRSRQSASAATSICCTSSRVPWSIARGENSPQVEWKSKSCCPRVSWNSQ